MAPSNLLSIRSLSLSLSQSVFLGFSGFHFLWMSKAAFDFASGLTGGIRKEDVLSTLEKYEKYHSCYGGEEKDRKDNYTDMVLDVGCGIGGPLREIAQFSMTSITGLNIHEYQITRGKALTRKAGLDKTCDFVKADFMKMPFPDNSFDAVYAIEATCHAPDLVACYKEIYRVLKPGQCFAVYEWCMTDSFDPHNQEHQNIKAEIELGNALPDIRSTGQCFEAVKQAGFEVIWDKDLAADSPVPWYLPLEKNQYFSAMGFRNTPVGRFILRNMAKGLEYIGLAPKGSQRVLHFMLKAADGLYDGGRKEIFTGMYFVLARKPHLDSELRAIICRVLKLGQCFAVYEWCITNSFDPHNKEHQNIKAEIELGNGLSEVRSTGQCLESVKQAGFEVIWDKDLAPDSPVPWYLRLETSQYSKVKGLEYVGLAPTGSQRVQEFLEKAADGLVNGGK
ncbi:hypothetical protein RHSIM_Rhsim07G0057400 [Rhododendron simsii]|uniref:Methyltransferase n=1 Tax=Rhododendron simsii TaxID=118357 RepID=A0A834GYI7_RHOSS|nr:hypothetical protein RHSIM_Rhsim07G0057400 [Rhododendron simsii]